MRLRRDRSRMRYRAAVAAGRRARALGATLASQPFFTGATAPWQVWPDPDGNEFCLTTDAGPAAPDSPGVGH